MTKIDVRLAGGDVLLPGIGFRKVDVLVADGRIAAVTEPDAGPTATETIPLGGLTVLPGACDVHLHLGHGSDISRPRQPSDADTETAAAAIGGVTSFIPYVMSTTPYAPLFDELKSVTEQGARIDFGFHFVISTDDQLAELPRYITEFGITDLVTWGAGPGFPPVEMNPSLERFATKVVPRVREQLADTH